MKDISIIIVSFNTCNMLRTCLQSIYRETLNIDFEVIVVDNNSTDNTKTMLEKNFPRVISIYNKKNRGFAYANNQGLKKAQGKNILLLNPDTLLQENSIFSTLKFAQSRSEIGIVGCQLLNVDRSWQSSVNGFPTCFGSFLESSFLSKLISQPFIILGYRIQRISLTHPSQVDWVMGAFFLIKRELVEKIGLLDERFFMYSEEMDYCFRARKVEYEVWYFPMTSVLHLWGGMNSLSKRSIAWVTISRNIFLQKHYDKLHRIIIQCITDVGLSIRFFGYLLFGIVLMRRKFLNKALNFFYALKYGGSGKIDYFKVP